LLKFLEIMNINCPKKHGLREFIIPGDNYLCALCPENENEVNEGATCYSCDQCDWGVCSDCVGVTNPG